MFRLFVIFLACLANERNPPAILLYTHDAVVWQPQQTIRGRLSGLMAEKVIVHHDQLSFTVPVDEEQFTFQLSLRDKASNIWVEADDAGSPVISDTICYTLGYDPAPVVEPFVTLKGDTAMLHATVLENPDQAPLKFLWKADTKNPALSEINHQEDSIASVRIPALPGKYYYTLHVVGNYDSTRFQTLVIRENETLRAFDIDTDYPSWMSKAIVYQITPYNFVAKGTFAAITAKLAELKVLGINTLWLQPVFTPSHRGQGYDVVDYLSVNPAFGTTSALQQLITEAKKLGMRVLFDLVLNHTSIEHPYAKDVIAYGKHSHYYDFYQHEKDRKPYSSFYQVDDNGFVFYFWDDLVNLNYQNEEVQRWMLEVSKYWVRKFDIDGYRFDAIWGVNARRPAFARQLRTELKSIKPDLLLLAEDKGADSTVFELGFDAAYDWTADTSWVSQWSWEYEYDEDKSKTIFKFPNVEHRGDLLRQVLFRPGNHAYRQLRYLENNDLSRFIQGHSLRQTKMAAALLFALPGIPMLYNGQEIGFRQHPYPTRAVFDRNVSIQALDSAGLFGYYQRLIYLRQQHPALQDTTLQNLPVSPDGALVAFRRWSAQENVVVLINMDSMATNATVDVRTALPDPSEPQAYQWNDVLTNTTYTAKTDSSLIEIPMEGYSVKWLLAKGDRE